MPDVLPEVTERLYPEFRFRTSLSTVMTVVQQCQTDLDAYSEAALPELLERLARQRLAELTAQQPSLFEPDSS